MPLWDSYRPRLRTPGVARNVEGEVSMLAKTIQNRYLNIEIKHLRRMCGHYGTICSYIQQQ